MAVAGGDGPEINWLAADSPETFLVDRLSEHISILTSCNRLKTHSIALFPIPYSLSPKTLVTVFDARFEHTSASPLLISLAKCPDNLAQTLSLMGTDDLGLHSCSSVKFCCI